MINLLDDPDENAFTVIRQQILLQGADAIPVLEQNLENTFDSIVHERIGSIIRKLRFDSLHIEFKDWLLNGSSDLLRGFILVSKTGSPSLDEKDIIIRIEQLKVDVWIELNENLTALENVKVMNHILFDIHHFDGDRGKKSAPESNFIQALLETRQGSALSLGILFIVLAQKLGLPVYGVNLPQHFILAYLSANGCEEPGEEDVLFYINPFNRGAVFTRREIELFIGQLKVRPEKSYFTPCSNAEIIRSLINSLLVSCHESGDTDYVEFLETLLTAYE